MLAVEEIRCLKLLSFPVYNEWNHGLPVYAGYSGIGSKPSCRSRGELVHSQTPPIPPWPASLLPLGVTATGCQCVKPTLAFSRLVKSSCEPFPFTEGRDGGVSSTPSCRRWLAHVSYVQAQSTMGQTRSQLGQSSRGVAPPPLVLDRQRDCRYFGLPPWSEYALPSKRHSLPVRCKRQTPASVKRT